MRTFLSNKTFFSFFVSPKYTSSKNWILSFTWDFAIQFSFRHKFRNLTHHYTFENIFKSCSVIKTTKIVSQTKGSFPTTFSSFFDCFIFLGQVCWCHNCLLLCVFLSISVGFFLGTGLQIYYLFAATELSCLGRTLKASLSLSDRSGEISRRSNADIKIVTDNCLKKLH